MLEFLVTDALGEGGHVAITMGRRLAGSDGRRSEECQRLAWRAKRCHEPRWSNPIVKSMQCALWESDASSPNNIRRIRKCFMPEKQVDQANERLLVNSVEEGQLSNQMWSSSL